MPFTNIKRNSSSIILEVYVVTTAGKPSTGVLPANVTVKAFYRGKAGAFVTDTVIAGATAVDVYESGKWQEVDAVNLQGVYQYSIPDPLFVTLDHEAIIVFTFSGAQPDQAEHIILATDNNILDPTGLDKVIIENNAGLVATAKNAIQLTLSLVGAATVGAGTSEIEFRKTGELQGDVAARVKTTFDSNNDRSIIVYDVSD